MQYLQSHGVQGAGGSNFGSGLGFIPSSSLQGLGGMGNEISGTGALGSFGSMPNRFGVVGLGQQEPAAAPQPSADAETKKKIEMLSTAIVEKEKKMESKMNRYLLYGAAAATAAFFILPKIMNR